MEFDFQAFEFVRMFLWEADLLYLLEIIVRVIIIFVFAVVLLRVVSNKWLKEMSFFDYFLVIALWSASGDPMFYPSVPLIYWLVAIAAVIFLKEWLSVLTMKSDYFLKMSVPDPIVLIENWTIHEKILNKKRIPKKALFSKLRLQGIRETGTITRCYLEPNGELSIFQRDDGKFYKVSHSVFPPKNVDDHDDILEH